MRALSRSTGCLIRLVPGPVVCKEKSQGMTPPFLDRYLLALTAFSVKGESLMSLTDKCLMLTISLTHQGYKR